MRICLESTSPSSLAVTLVLTLACALPLISVPGLSASDPAQFGYVDIFTDRGGQGLNQYGGSYMVGETIVVYVYSGFDGIAYITIYEPDGRVVGVDAFYVYAGQTGYFTLIASNPPGTSQLVLEVCPAGGPVTTPITTWYMAPPLQHAESPVANPHDARNPPMGCASDTTWVDVIGGPADLTVSRCKVIPAKPKQEDLMTFQANVANIGGTDAYSFRMETYLDGELYDSGTLSLRAGESSQVSSERPWIAEGRPT